MRDLKHKKLTMLDRARARVAKGPTDPSIKQCWAYVGAVVESIGRILYIILLGLPLAVLRGLDAGLVAFAKELGRDL